MLKYWIGPMFVYGAYRGYRVERKPPNDLMSHRYMRSILNGCMYASPLGLFKLIHLTDRIEILLCKKNSPMYCECYEEIIGTNHDVI